MVREFIHFQVILCSKFNVSSISLTLIPFCPHVAIFRGETTQIVRLMLTIIEKFRTNTGKVAALEHAASVQVIDINPDSGFLRVMLRQREKEKTELDLKMRMEKAKEAASAKKQALDQISEDPEESQQSTVTTSDTTTTDLAPVPTAPSNVKLPIAPTASINPVVSQQDDVSKLPKSTSFLVRALSSLKREKEKVRRHVSVQRRRLCPDSNAILLQVELDQDLSLDDLDINILDQDILDLDELDIDAAMKEQDKMIHAAEVKIVEETSVLDDLDAMEEFLQSVATDEELDFDL